MARLNLACRCGAVSWRLEETAPRSGIRYVCHCDDCQAYAEFLGSSDSILDANGGIHAYQLPASRFRLVTGIEELACVQVTRRPLLRWYCRKCRTPVAGTYHTSKLSFLSVTIPCQGSREVDQVLGLSSGHVWTQFGWGDLSSVRQVNIPAMLWRMGSRILTARISGDYRKNPLFDPVTAKPIAPPRRLTGDERAALDAKVQRSHAA